MTENLEKAFTLCNNLAAISSQPTANIIIATDGITKSIYQIENNCCNNCINTLRPYNRLRISPCGNHFTALSNCDNKVYCLDSNYCEIGAISLYSQNNCNCARRFYSLIDASETCIGESVFLIGAFNTGAYLFSRNGKMVSELYTPECNEILTDFIAFGDGKYALSTIYGNQRNVTIIDNCNQQTSTLSNTFSLRMLFYENETVYGLFGIDYLYNRIIPIYADGRLSLPNRNERFLCN